MRVGSENGLWWWKEACRGGGGVRDSVGGRNWKICLQKMCGQL